jgi:hypothetical protein
LQLLQARIRAWRLAVRAGRAQGGDPGVAPALLLDASTAVSAWCSSRWSMRSLASSALSTRVPCVRPPHVCTRACVASARGTRLSRPSAPAPGMIQVISTESAPSGDPQNTIRDSSSAIAANASAVAKEACGSARRAGEVAMRRGRRPEGSRPDRRPGDRSRRRSPSSTRHTSRSTARGSCSPARTWGNSERPRACVRPDSMGYVTSAVSPSAALHRIRLTRNRGTGHDSRDGVIGQRIGSPFHERSVTRRG